MKKNILLLTNLLLAGLLATACSPATVDKNALRTEVAATIYVRLTIQAQAVTETTFPAVTSTLRARDLSTPASIATPTRSPTSTPTTTPTRTLTLTPTLASVNTPTPSPCLPDAVFVEDVTVPDGTNFAAGETFTKTWRMRSAGCAPWPTGSTWVFDSGDQMAAPESVSVPDIPLGSTADISVEMVAPDAPGTYTSFWQMQGPGGARFGNRVYVEIAVPGPTPTPLACPPNPALVKVSDELSV